MLIEFRVANFRSIGQEQTLSMVAGNDSNHLENLIDCGDMKLLKSAVVYGANASGKSNLIRAVQSAVKFIRESATRMNKGDKIHCASPFRLDLKLKYGPSSFAMVFILDGIRYEYGFSVNREIVVEEWLFAFPKKRLQRWLHRKISPTSKIGVWHIRGPLKPYSDDLVEKTRDNCLAISQGANLNINILSNIFLFFRNSVRVYDFSKGLTPLMQLTADRMQRDELYRTRVLAFMRDADLGIEDIEVQRGGIPLLGSMDSAVKGAVPTSFQIRTKHYGQLPGSAEIFSMDDESNGTRRFFAIAYPFLKAIDTGTPLIIDELECSIHPLLTRRLIELFQSPAANQKGAQLIFATHDTTLMDSQLFRRDQVWLVEKNSSGQSTLTSLYDFKPDHRPRSSEAFQRNYLAGRYGGVPSFGPIFEDLEIA